MAVLRDRRSSSISPPMDRFWHEFGRLRRCSEPVRLLRSKRPDQHLDCDAVREVAIAVLKPSQQPLAKRFFVFSIVKAHAVSRSFT